MAWLLRVASVLTMTRVLKYLTIEIIQFAGCDYIAKLRWQVTIVQAGYVKCLRSGMRRLKSVRVFICFLDET